MTIKGRNATMAIMDELVDWRRFGVHNGRPVYVVYSSEIRRWVENQSRGNWNPYIYAPQDYVFTPEFETMFLLRWS